MTQASLVTANRNSLGKMKAVVCTKYGPADVLQIKEVPMPVPNANEVLVKIAATTVSSGDYSIRNMKTPPGFSLIYRIVMGFGKPRKSILGSELAGEVVLVGESVTDFKVGDRVFAYSGVNLGAHAEYICLAEKMAVTHIPEDTSYEEATVIPHGGLAALYFLRDKGKVQRDEQVLILGASGAVGSAAVQIAKYFGANVTGVCGAENLDLVKSLGVDEVIDYKNEDFSKNGESYDIIFDTVGNYPFAYCRNSLKENGRYLLTLAGIPDFIRGVWTSLAGGKKLIGGVATERKEDLIFLKKLVEGNYLKSVIDRCYPLEEIVEANLYAESGHKKGSVVIRVKQNSE